MDKRSPGSGGGSTRFGFSFPASMKQEWRPDMLAVLVSRAFMFVILYWAAGAFSQGSAPRSVVMAYGLSTILFLATWIFMPHSQDKLPARFLLFFQFLVELFAESVVFVSSGGYDSYHGFLFILTIVSGGVFFGYAGSLILATFSSLIFAGVGFMHLGATWFSDLVTLPRLPLDVMQMRFFLTTALFFLVALLSSDGSRRMALVRKELAGAKEALHLARFSTESMLQDLPTGLLFFDHNQQLRYRNLPSEQILGKALPEGVNPTEAWSGILDPEAVARLIRNQGGVVYTEAVTGKDKPIRVLYKPLLRGAENLGCIFTVFDLTDEKRMEHRLMRQERMAALGQMSARIAHEIRNPLASISGSAQMLRDSPLAGNEDQKLLKLIVGESNRLNRFLSDLLEYVRDRPPSFRPVQLQGIFKRVIPLLEKSPAFRSGLVKVEEKVQGENLNLVTDQDILLQVLLNVGLNALEAMEAVGGTLTLAASLSQEGIDITVTDTGPGMDTPTLSRALDPFFTTKPQGTGLGLAVCAHSMQTLQGNINLTSSPGQGTIVSLFLPLEPKFGGIKNNGNQA